MICRLLEGEPPTWMLPAKHCMDQRTNMSVQQLAPDMPYAPSEYVHDMRMMSSL